MFLEVYGIYSITFVLSLFFLIITLITKSKSPQIKRHRLKCKINDFWSHENFVEDERISNTFTCRPVQIIYVYSVDSRLKSIFIRTLISLKCSVT